MTMKQNRISCYFIAFFLYFLLSNINSFKIFSIGNVKDRSYSYQFIYSQNLKYIALKAAKKSTEFETEIEFSQPSTSTKAPAAAVKENDLNDGPGEELRVKLKEEISSPFRKVRQFLYSGMGIAGLLGTVTALPQLIFAIKDGGDTLINAGGNVAIDIGAIALAAVLWDKDSKAEKIKLERYTRKEKLLSYQMTNVEKEEREKELSLLPIQIQISEKDENVTRIVSLGDLQVKGKQNIIIVAGKSDFVKDVIISAKIEGADIFNSKDTYIVPVVLEDDQLETALKKGFGAQKEGLMSAPYIGKPMQVCIVGF